MSELTDDRLRLVRQEHPEGCLIACLAMCSGKTYAEVDGMFIRDRYSDGGLNDYQVFDFLAREGFFWQHFHRYTLIGELKERPVWPLPLSTDLAICRVDAGRGGHLSHGIVVTRDGTAYDPALGIRRFSDYSAVGSMTFLRAAASTSTEAVGVVNIGLDGVARWPNGDPVALTPPTELTDDRLLSCPFCGFPGVLAEETHDTNDPYVYCSNDACGVGGPGFPGGGNTRDEAIAAWNRRAAASTSTEAVAAIEALRTLTSAVEHMRVPQNIAEAAMQVELTIGPALRSAQDALRSLTPPTPKVTTDEAEERE